MHAVGVTDLRVLTGGTEAPTYLLLHGLGATAEVWDGLTARLGDATWVAPDLPGHGRSSALPSYSFAGVAAAVAGLVDPRGTVIVGHSFGGVVGLHLAGRPGVRAVVGLGIKVDWSDEELARAAALAERPAPVYATRDEAAHRHLRIAGLAAPAPVTGPVPAPAAEPVLGAGPAPAPAAEPASVAGSVPAAALVETAEGWRPAFDPRVFAVGDPHVAALLAVASVPVVLARGADDPMVSADQITTLGVDPVELPGLGHNAHVEAPEVLLPLLELFVSRRAG